MSYGYIYQIKHRNIILQVVTTNFFYLRPIWKTAHGLNLEIAASDDQLWEGIASQFDMISISWPPSELSTLWSCFVFSQFWHSLSGTMHTFGFWRTTGSNGHNIDMGMPHDLQIGLCFRMKRWKISIMGNKGMFRTLRRIDWRTSPFPGRSRWHTAAKRCLGRLTWTEFPLQA